MRIARWWALPTPLTMCWRASLYPSSIAGRFDQYRTANAKQRATGNIGAGALIYEGAQGIDNDAVSFWQLSLYGGVTVASDDGREFSSKFGVMTGPKSIADRAEQRVARGEYIIRPA